MCDFKGLRRLRSIGPQPRAGSGLQDRPSSACPILVGWVPTATAAKFFRASYWNSSLKQALSKEMMALLERSPRLGALVFSTNGNEPYQGFSKARAFSVKSGSAFKLYPELHPSQPIGFSESGEGGRKLGPHSRSTIRM